MLFLFGLAKITYESMERYLNLLWFRRTTRIAGKQIARTFENSI